MILPTKHIDLRKSLLWSGALVLERLEKPGSISALWEEVRYLPEVGTFERFSLVLDFLYAIGAVQLSEGLLRRCPK